jgi:hypothetical protein
MQTHDTFSVKVMWILIAQNLVLLTFHQIILFVAPQDLKRDPLGDIFSAIHCQSMFVGKFVQALKTGAINGLT